MTINRNERRHQFTRGAEVMRHEFGLYFSALYLSFVIACIAGLGTSVFVINAALSADEAEIFIDRMLATYNVKTGAATDKVKMTFRRGDAIKIYQMRADKLLAATSPEWMTIKTKLWYSMWGSVASGAMLFFFDKLGVASVRKGGGEG